MSVATRGIVRVQDQDDVDVSLGAAVDGYGLIYDHATGVFGTPFTGYGLRVATNVVPESFTIPLNCTAIYSDMQVPPSVTVEVAGMLVDPGWGGDTTSADFTLVSPYVAAAHVYKGNTHCHSTNSDGSGTPTVVVTAYKAAGYDFISITDHSDHTYGYAASVDPGVSGILFIPGTESSDDHYAHTNCINASVAGTGTAQEIITAAVARGEFVYRAHPRFPILSDEAANTNLLALTGYHGIEIWNSVVEYVLDGVGNTETQADYLLTLGRQIVLMTGDDTHNYSDPGNGLATSAVYVYADSLSIATIIAALKAGNFYASNGALIDSISVDYHDITVAAPVSSTFEFIGSGGTVYQTTTTATTATYTVQGTESYIRVRVTRDSDSLLAWTNPFYIS